MTAYFCVFKFLASFLEADKTFFELVIFPNSSVLRSEKTLIECVLQHMWTKHRTKKCQVFALQLIYFVCRESNNCQQNIVEGTNDRK